MSISTVFVCGATGTQGGVLARHLRAKNIQVHALARDPASDKAKALESIGVKLWAGDYDNTDALTAATVDCNAIFINLMPDFTDLTAEARWTKNILDAGKAAGATHVVYSSGFGVSETHKMKYLDQQGIVAIILRSKLGVEKQVQDSGYASWAILRPGNFMANFIQPLVRMYAGLVEQGVWASALLPESMIPMIDTETVGKFSSSAILKPERFHGKIITYADEFLNAAQIVEQLSHATGRELKVVHLTEEEVDAQKGVNPFIGGQLAMRDMDQFVDLEDVKEWGIPLGTFKEFLQREKDAVEKTYNKSA
ncbi:hypothetical protein B0T10DRAFT_549284 [Thelonectria olida]|uniref:NmrA-like domain-containing protein n=1 Tax=Thelonectria olida TaxID=1576542 RepID=A0A9P8W2W0_9HYPO|nr:hypothetical protein B0T10DRAFT_549284 [Thelonectria olida]